MKYLFYLLRPHQWIKNIFVLTGIIFAHAWHDLITVKQAFITLFAFCFVSSAMYIFNDIVDINSDRLHPIKKQRPLAAGTVTLKQAIALAVIVVTLGLCLAFLVSITVGYILLAYAFLNIAYSKFFKQQAILDVFAITAGFLLRVLAGTAGIGIHPSSWLLFCSGMLALFLSFSKRQSELQLFNQQQLTLPANLKYYTVGLLDKLTTITVTSAIVGYTLYTLQQDSMLFAGEHRLIYTVPIVLLGIFRYLYLLENKSNSGLDMAQDLIKDFQLLTITILWLVAVIILGAR